MIELKLSNKKITQNRKNQLFGSFEPDRLKKEKCGRIKVRKSAEIDLKYLKECFVEILHKISKSVELRVKKQ